MHNSNFVLKRSLIISFLLLVTSIVFSQAPGIRWQQTIGGESIDEYHSLVKTNDNGFITIGKTDSRGGKFTGNHGNFDIWIEKFNADGISQWHKILGGSLSDQPVYSYYNPDGSIVILGATLSIDGDITNNHGAKDIWVFKLDAGGNLLWQKCFGGTLNDHPGIIIKSLDGNYIISGVTYSNDGNLTNNHGRTDAWIFKINENGSLLWQKNLGGTGSEGWLSSEEDASVNMIVEALDGSIYLSSTTDSNDMDVSGNHGPDDVWLVKLNNEGDVQWQKCLGGSQNENGAYISIAPSGNIYVAGGTNSADLPSFHGDDDILLNIVSPTGDLLFQKCFGGSEADYLYSIVSIDNDGSCVISAQVRSGDGDIIGAHYTEHAYDLWIFKINLLGQIVWQKTLGGFMSEEFWGEHSVLNGQGPNFALGIGGVIKTQDGGFLVTSYSESHDGDIVGFHEPGPADPAGPADLWVVKLSDSGLYEWQRSLGGSKSEVPKCPALEIGSNNYIIAGLANSINGDIQKNNGTWDGWLVNFGAVNTIKGSVFIDQNGNGNKDPEDSLYSNVVVNAANPLHPETAVPYKGNFIIETDTGVYNVSLQSLLPYFTITPTSHVSNFSTYFNKDSFSFALQPIPGRQDLTIDVIPVSRARAGFEASYLINYKNAGTTSIPSGQVIFVKDNHTSFLSANPVTSSISGDTLRWDYSILAPLAENWINLKLRVQDPPVVKINDTLSSLAIITPVAADLTPHNDTAVLVQRVQGSFDPNDKAENLGGSIARERVVAGDFITYFIRFQNTGTDTAFNVVVRDTLDNKLDWSSFQMIASSHPYTLQIDDQNKLIWTFYNIMLPDSNVNEPASHGYIAYRIKADNSLNIGASFLNRASIYFDFNLPVHTNFAPMVVGTPITLPLKLLDFDAQYQQPNAQLKWITVDESNVDRFVIERGEDPFYFVPVGSLASKGGASGGKAYYQFFDKLLTVNGDKFYYRLKMVDQDNKYTYSNIILVKRSGTVKNEVTINPNPARSGIIMANINCNKDIQAVLSITDMQGRVFNTRQQYINKGYNLIPISGMGLPTGNYFLQVKAEGKQMVTRFVITQ